MNFYPRSLAFVHSILLMSIALFCGVASSQTAASSPSRETMKRMLLRQSLHFEATADGGMSSRGMGRKVRIDGGGAVMFGERDKGAVSVVLDGANSHATPEGRDLLTVQSNYLLGNKPTQWRTGVSQFGRVQVSAVYPGVDLVYYGNGEQLEHDYLIAANADPGMIRMKFRGASPRLDGKTGELVLKQPDSSEDAIRMERPVAYQLSEGGTRQGVMASYHLGADGDAQFTLGSYDHARPLVIDPVIVYGSYFGGKYTDSIVDLKVAGDGSLFLLLTTDSTDLTMPGATAGACIGKCGPANADGGTSTAPDMYVVKFDPTFQQPLFATYLGGSGSDQAYNLALDTDGSIYVAGATQSTDFPIVNGYPGGAPAGGKTSGTLTKLSADGSMILYSTFIGYGRPSVNYAPPVMATANNGIVYVIGQSGASDLAFIWQKNSLFHIAVDFLAQLDTTKTGTDSVVYATYVGDSIDGANVVTLSSLALDSKGDVWLYGSTHDNMFPTTDASALEPQCRSTPCDATFLMEIDPTGSTIPYATYLGGVDGASNVYIYPRDIVIDPSDNVYVSGYTSQAGFPTLNGYEIAIDGNQAGYISKLSPDGKTLLYSTYVPVGVEIAVSTKGLLAFTGVAGSGFPVKNNLQTPQLSPNVYDVVFGLIDTTQSFDSSLLVSSFLGSTQGATVPERVYLSPTGPILIVGTTSATDLRIVNGYQVTRSGGTSDGFITAIDPGILTLTPSTLTFPSTSIGSTSVAMTATLYNGTAKSVELAQGKLSNSTDFAQTNNCAILSPKASCTINITFTPMSAGTLTSTYTTGDLDFPNNPLTIALTGNATGATVTLSPTALDFGMVTDGTTTTQSVTLTNDSTTALPVTGAVVAGTGFALSGNTCGASVAAGATCQFAITVAPTAPSPYAGTLTVTDGFGTQIVQLTATGAAAPAAGSDTLSPANLDFGVVPVGTVATKLVTFTNGSDATIAIYTNVNSNNAFSVTATTCFISVQPHASCTLTLQFAPTYTSTQTETFQVVDKVSNPTINVTGTTFIVSPQVTLTPNPLIFKDIPQNQQTIQLITVTNNSTFPISWQFGNVTLTGGTQGFVPDNGTLATCRDNGNGGTTVAAGGSCQYGIGFQGNIATDTSETAILTIPYTLPGSTFQYGASVTLTANVVTPAAATVTPKNIQFPATAAGSKSPAQIVTVSNSGEAPLGFTSATFTGANPTAFTQTSNCPSAIAKNASCQISVTFGPDASTNEFTASLDVKLSTGDVSVTLNGGTSPMDFVVTSPTGTQNGNSSPSWLINIAPLTASIGFNQPITFTVSSLDPSYGTPTFTPSTVTPNGSSVSTTLTLTNPQQVMMKRPPFNSRQGWPVLACFALCLPFAWKLKPIRNRKILLFLLCSLAGGLVLNGCGDDPPAIVFTVNATSGSISHTVNLTLQP
ncbi:choice-of-anchor D domain-containing protein [Granulicella tundricola]|uniref:Choice-of-anchor D domain-containing protein n=1 Tax=Granulicella tundricola (strain ATCC BAA-1859 / DSM 23138 / MP5ACTX9) TaxID=1198114 RepID=E8X2H5_GRATM|nr:choice-of-anchor D domain-containing protein [Granulicella tundricola]ADW69199.1 hypothetical protein AciX9_2155 [Granulicella tundricola MP5ACTX9]